MTPCFSAFLVKVAAARKKKKAPGSGAGRALAVGTLAGAAGGLAGGAAVAHTVKKTLTSEIGKARAEVAGHVKAIGGKVRDFSRMGLLQKLKFLIKKR